MQEAKPIAPGKFADIDLSEISVSWNPRKTFDAESLKDLAASIRSEGVLQPIRVRPAAKGYDLVCGERRVRASKLAGLKTVPAIVKAMSDQEAIEAKAVENDQREDVHPLEQAECYRRLLMPPEGATWKPLTVAQIATRVGRAPSFIAQRLRLGDLCETVRKAYTDGGLALGAVLEIAKLPTEVQQAECLEAVKSYWGSDAQNCTTAEVREIVRDRFLLKLSAATFEVGDATLVPAAGACSSCPKRTGAQKELFADVGKDDLCTDRACWKQKQEANWDRLAADHVKKGGKTLSLARSEKMFHDGRLNSYSANAFELTAKCEQDPKRRTFKQLLGKTAKSVAYLADNGKGKGVLVVLEKDVADALKAAGHKFAAKKKAASGGVSQENWNLREEKQKQKRAAVEPVTRQIMTEVVSAAADMKLLQLVDALLPAVTDDNGDGCSLVAVRRGWVKEERYDRKVGKLVLDKAKAMQPIDRVGLFVELLVGHLGRPTWEGKVEPGLVAVAKAFDVDVEAIKRTVAEVRAEAEAKTR